MATPVRAVGTDPKMVINARTQVRSWTYTGAPVPPPAIGARFANPAKTADILASSVVGSLLDEAFFPPIPSPAKLAKSGVWRAIRKDLPSFCRRESRGPARSEALAKAIDGGELIRVFVKARLSNMFSQPPADAGAATSRACCTASGRPHLISTTARCRICGNC